LRQRKDEEKHKHDSILEEGKEIVELNYVDVDKEHTSKLNKITDQWQALWGKCDKWYKAVTTSQKFRSQIELKEQTEVRNMLF